MPIPLPHGPNLWELLPLRTRCTDIPPAPPVVATFDSLDGMSGVDVAEPLPPFLYLGIEAPTATLPLAVATLVVTSPLALISLDPYVGLSILGSAGGGMERAADLSASKN